MSWKNVLSIVAVSALLGVPLQTLGDNDRNGRGGGHDRDHEKREHDRKAKKKAEKDAQYAAQLTDRYSVLAGSPENAGSLVKGLHDGTSVTLKSKTISVPPPPVPGTCPRTGCSTLPPVEVEVVLTFDVPTRAMKYKQVAIALAVMETKLESLDPSTRMVTATPAQIKQVLIGEPAAPGILAMRAAKMNWIQIARKQGLTVADFRQVKSNHDEDHDDDDD